MGRVQITLQKKIEIKTLLQIGFSQRTVARESNVSQKCVFGVSKKLKQNLPLSNSVGQGRTKATMASDDNLLV
jgi:hypothetical protein